MIAERPRGVELHRGDTGEVIPIEVAYMGPSDDGFQVWASMTEVNLDRGDTVTVVYMHPMTRVEFPNGGSSGG